MADTYLDPIIQKYIELLKEKCGGIKSFYEGEPIKIPSVDLPCVMISKRETRVGPLTNAEDEHGISLSLTLITDVRKDLSTDDDIAKVVAGVTTLYELMEGRNADYTLRDTSILSVLRHNPILDAAHNLRTDLGTVTRIDYGQTLQGRLPESWTVEARIDFVAYFTQVR